MSGGEALIELGAVEVRRDGRRILDVERLRIDRGRTLLLTGANGAGKSTLLKLLAGLLLADAGSLRCRGVEMARGSAARYCRGRHVYLHQTPYMFDGSVRDNLAYGLRQRDEPRATRDAEVDQALAWADLDALALRHARALSLGEQQRVALGRARLLDPSLLLLDEVGANLDGANQRLVQTLIAERRARGASVVVATHEPAPLLALVDFHLHLDGGRLAVVQRDFGSVVPLRRPRTPGRS
ncbi:MAG: ATP-binding cassette domain-containing protein [Gammaproteobacteria bacterium]|nr:ATP-binding cassette domain-containing protein [Gammaproteobacteria bacterium]